MSAAFSAMLAAERIKLTSTRSPIIAGVGVATLGVGSALLAAVGVGAFGSVRPGDAVLGLVVLGVPVLMVVAALTVTGEYRAGLVRTSLTAMPSRAALLAVKATVAAVYAASVAGSTAALALSAVVAVSPEQAVGMSPGDRSAWLTVGGVALYAGLAAVLAVGLGALVRHSAGAVTVLLLGPFVVEPVLGVLPDTSETLGPLLPFRNALRVLDVPWLYLDSGLWWGPLGSLIYFAAVSLAVFAAGAVAFSRRDA